MFFDIKIYFYFLKYHSIKFYNINLKIQGDLRPISEIQNQLDKPERTSCYALLQHLTLVACE